MLTNNARCNPTRPLKAQAALWGALLLGLATPAVPAESFPVLIRVEAAKSQGDLKPIWRFFGADEPNYAYMQHGRKLVSDLHGMGLSAEGLRPVG